MRASVATARSTAVPATMGLSPTAATMAARAVTVTARATRSSEENIVCVFDREGFSWLKEGSLAFYGVADSYKADRIYRADRMG
jgi:hypothetical protein